MAKSGESAAILETLGDFTSKENWDKFFTLRGAGDSFEWYAEWPSLRAPLIAQLAAVPSAAAAAAEVPMQILVPGCGSSRVSEHLYDAGFRHITSIDFSKVVVSDMLRRYVRSRPEMRWRVMDMTDMQFADEFFDAILDKGGLDALMEPEVGPMLGSKYLKEVKRVLKLGGKFLCLTLAESHVLDLQLGAKGNLKELCPGQRFQLVLGEQGGSLYNYKTILLDARPQPDPFLYGYGVFIVPKLDSSS